MKKSKLSDKRREQIKSNFNPNKPPVRVNEKLYWNKIKAGKARQEKGFRDNAGRFLALPESFTNKYVKQIAEEKGQTVKEFLKDKDNLRDAKQLFHNKSVSWTYNPESVEKAIRNTKGNFIIIDDGNGQTRMSKDNALLYVQQQKRNILEAGGYTMTFKGEHREDFTKFIIYLENFDGMEDIEEMDDYIFFDESNVVTSGRKK